MRPSFERLEMTHSKSRSHPKSRLCCSRTIQVFDAGNEPAQQSLTRQTGRLEFVSDVLHPYDVVLFWTKQNL